MHLSALAISLQNFSSFGAETKTLMSLQKLDRLLDLAMLGRVESWIAYGMHRRIEELNFLH